MSDSETYRQQARNGSESNSRSDNSFASDTSRRIDNHAEKAFTLKTDRSGDQFLVGIDVASVSVAVQAPRRALSPVVWTASAVSRLTATLDPRSLWRDDQDDVDRDDLEERVARIEEQIQDRQETVATDGGEP